MTAASQVLGRVLELYDDGQYVQAYAAGRSLGRLPDWPGTEGRVMAGRLAVHLGAPKLSWVMLQTAYRRDPTNAEACFYAGASRLSRFGPVAAWRFQREVGELRGASAGVAAIWFGLRALVLGALRDFHRADNWMKRAEEASPDDPFVCVQRAGLLEMQDRRDEALIVGRRAMEIRPWFRPGVECVAHLLVQLGRDDQSLALLGEAVERIESAPLAWSLAGMLSELERFDEAWALCDRVEQFTPLLETQMAIGRGGLRALLA